MMYAFPGGSSRTGAPIAYLSGGNHLKGGGAAGCVPCAYPPGYVSHVPASESSETAMASSAGGAAGVFPGAPGVAGYVSSTADSVGGYMARISECSVSPGGPCVSMGVSPDGNPPAAMRGGPPALFASTRGKTGRSSRHTGGGGPFPADSPYPQSASNTDASHVFLGGELRGGSSYGGFSSHSSGGGFPPRLRKEGDWECTDPACGNINFSKRTRCNRCGKARGKTATGQPLGQQPSGPGGGPLPAPHLGGPPGIFRQGDWPCVLCGNVNWARRSTCNICSAPKPHSHEEQPRTGRGGGHFDLQDPNDRRRHDSDDEDFDEFGRKKRKPQQQRTADSSSAAGGSGSSCLSAGSYRSDYHSYPPADPSRSVEASSCLRPGEVAGGREDNAAFGVPPEGSPSSSRSEKPALGAGNCSDAIRSEDASLGAIADTTVKNQRQTEREGLETSVTQQEQSSEQEEQQQREGVWHPDYVSQTQTTQQLIAGETPGYPRVAAAGGLLSGGGAYVAATQRSSSGGISAFAGEGVIKLAFPPAPKRPRALSYDSSSSDSDSSSRSSSSPRSHRRGGGGGSSSAARRRSRSRSSSRQRSSRAAQQRSRKPTKGSSSSAAEVETAAATSGSSRRNKRW